MFIFKVLKTELGLQMKIFNSLIITGFLIPFLPISAETTDVVELREEASLTTLDEELLLLDEEFEEFKEELYSLENDLQKPTPEVSSAPEELALETKEPLTSDIDPVTVSEWVPSNIAANELAPPENAKVEEPLVALVPQAVPASVVAGKKPAEEAPAVLNVQGTSLIGEQMPLDEDVIAIDLQQAFEGSPIIYSLLFAMSVIAVGIWLYSILSLRFTARVSVQMVKNLENRLNSNHFDEALHLCDEKNDLFCKMIASGIHSRRHGLPVMIEAMKAEGKRSSISFWQKIGLLNDIAIIAPMLGLLGTVLGMFYAFYDVNRSIESISTLFDGLGISVGTTVAGLIVAILALILHSTAKYRLVRALTLVENQAQSVATIIDDRTSIYKG
jgi:biopolymer transport protein ExbB